MELILSTKSTRTRVYFAYVGHDFFSYKLQIVLLGVRVDFVDERIACQKMEVDKNEKRRQVARFISRSK